MGVSSKISRITEYYTRHGFKAMIRRAQVSLNRVLYANRVFVFYLDLTRQTLRPIALPSSCKIDRIRTAGGLSAQDLEAMVNIWNPTLARRNMAERFAKDAELWIIKSGEQLAGYCWTIRGKAIAPYYFPIAQDDVQLFDVYALPQFRGGGTTWYLIGSMLHALQADGVARVYADMAEWNRPSLAFYKMTPFRPLGLARSFVIGGRRFTYWDEGEVAEQVQKAIKGRTSARVMARPHEQ